LGILRNPRIRFGDPTILRNLTLPLYRLLENYSPVTGEQIETALDFLTAAADPVFSGDPSPGVVVHANPFR